MSTETATTITFTDLNRFRRDVLFAARAWELDEGNPPNGTQIVEVLEEDLGYDSVSDGHLYPNLNTLAEQGFMQKQPVDDRSNAYRVTEYGVTMLEERVQREASFCGMGIPERPSMEGGEL